MSYQYYTSSIPLSVSIPPITVKNNGDAPIPPYPTPDTVDASFDSPIKRCKRSELELDIKTPRFVVAIDIETLGSDMCKHALVAIGAVLMSVEESTDSAPKEKFACYMNVPDDRGYDPVCKAEYWDNHDKFPMNVTIKQRFENSNISLALGIAMFAEWLDACDRKYQDLGKTQLVVDTVDFDATWISYHFAHILHRPPLTCVFGDPSKYRSMAHANEFAKGYLGKAAFGASWKKALVKKGVNLPPDSLHDHDPVHDAEYIARTYIAIIHHMYNFPKK
jgi:hypothetical protein